MAKKKKLTVVTAADDVEENPYLLVVGMQESTVTMKKSLASSYKAKYSLTM